MAYVPIPTRTSADTNSAADINQLQDNIVGVLLSGAGAPTSTPDIVGQIYLDTTGKREYRAYGTSSSADWIKVPVFKSGTVTVTSGGGDVTVTLPWDWSGGHLVVIKSTATAEWCEDGQNVAHCKYETSYDALTAAGYTTTSVLGLYKTTTAEDTIRPLLKSSNDAGLPNAATSTTFVLNDNGASTVYLKWFVWA